MVQCSCIFTCSCVSSENFGVKKFFYSFHVAGAPQFFTAASNESKSFQTLMIAKCITYNRVMHICVHYTHKVYTCTVYSE